MNFTHKLILIISVLLISSCGYEKPKQTFYHSQRAIGKTTFDTDSKGVRINIPNLNWDVYTPGVARVGWCGEASIQMIALHYGYYHSQKTINNFAKPKHLDLYSDEVEPVMKHLGFKYTPYVNKVSQKPDKYIRWVKDSISSKSPVFSGVKRNPSGNPSWFLDHFVVFTGFESGNIIYNSNNANYGKVSVEESLFLSSSKPYMLKNSANFYFGFSVHDVDLYEGNKMGSNSVRLLVLGETESNVDLGLRIQGLSPGARYLLSRYRVDMESKQYVEDNIEEVIASKETMTFQHISLNKHDSYFYTIEKSKKNRELSL